MSWDRFNERYESESYLDSYILACREHPRRDMSIGDRSFKVIIIGGGLAGCLLANGLIRHGVEVQVYERLSKDSKREGYQIRLGAAALKGMRACLSQKHLNAIVQKFGRSNGSKSEAPVVYDRSFNQLLDLSAFPSYNKSAPISRVVLRDALAAPVASDGRLKYACQFDRYQILNPGTVDEKVRVYFQDDTHDDCDILIAADGSHSKINKQIGLDNILQLDSYMSMIAKNELPTKTYLESNPVICHQPILVFDDSKALYFCVYLPEVADQEGLMDESLSSSFFGCHIPTSQCPENLSTMSTDQKWQFVSSALKEWGPEYHQMIDLVRGCDLYVYQGRVSQEPPKRWREKVTSSTLPERGHRRVWMIGDSVHAMLPNRGMGGNTAMCDTATALPLLCRLASLRESGSMILDDIAQACDEYEKEMMPRAFEWVKKSGGSNIMMVDAGTLSGRLIFRVAAIVVWVASYWYALTGIFVKHTFVDDAPELK